LVIALAAGAIAVKSFASDPQRQHCDYCSVRRGQERNAKILVERRKCIMKKFLMNEEGQGMVEYGLIIALVAVVVIGAITLLSGGIKNTFTKATDNLNK